MGFYSKKRKQNQKRNTKKYRGGTLLNVNNGLNDIGKYDGGVANNQRHGRGKMIYKNGDKYIGDWNNDKKEGNGLMIYSNGSSYEGEWKNDKKNGNGVFTTSNSIYKGYFNDGDELNGIFTVSNIDGSEIFEGNLINGIKTGNGKMKFSNGDEYTGNWDNDYMSGNGTMKFSDGNEYTGNWDNDYMSGNGTMKFYDGGEYIGNWVNSIFNGNGTMKFSDGDEYNGNLVNGIINGYGKMTYKNGDEYNGRWINSNRHGNGIMKYNNGDEYIGQWYDNEKDGYGEMKYNNGVIKKGYWMRDYFLDYIRTYLLYSTEKRKKDENIHNEIFNRLPDVDPEQLREMTNLDIIIFNERRRGEEGEHHYIDIERPIIAYEIHKASHKINMVRYMELIETNPDIQYTDISKEAIVKKVKDLIIPKINENDIIKLNTVLEQLLYGYLWNTAVNKNIIGKTIDFVFNQSNEFIEFYINAFIQDSYYAYDTDKEGAGLSCADGIVERFYMVVGDTIFAICPEGYCENSIYKELLKVFGKPVNINNFTEEWATQYLESEEIKNMDKKSRKKHYIDFMRQKYAELNMLADYEDRIIKEANNLDYVFVSLAFGGGNTRKPQKSKPKPKSKSANRNAK
jgi:hypothetical protein